MFEFESVSRISFWFSVTLHLILLCTIESWSSTSNSVDRPIRVANLRAIVLLRSEKTVAFLSQRFVERYRSEIRLFRTVTIEWRFFHRERIRASMTFRASFAELWPYVSGSHWKAVKMPRISFETAWIETVSGSRVDCTAREWSNPIGDWSVFRLYVRCIEFLIRVDYTGLQRTLITIYTKQNIVTTSE